MPGRAEKAHSHHQGASHPLFSEDTTDLTVTTFYLSPPLSAGLIPTNLLLQHGFGGQTKGTDTSTYCILCKTCSEHLACLSWQKCPGDATYVTKEPIKCSLKFSIQLKLAECRLYTSLFWTQFQLLGLTQKYKKFSQLSTQKRPIWGLVFKNEFQVKDHFSLFHALSSYKVYTQEFPLTA